MNFQIKLPSGRILEETTSPTVAGAWTKLLKLNSNLLPYSERKLKEMGYSIKRIPTNDTK